MRDKVKALLLKRKVSSNSEDQTPSLSPAGVTSTSESQGVGSASTSSQTKIKSAKVDTFLASRGDTKSHVNDGHKASKEVKMDKRSIATRQDQEADSARRHPDSSYTPPRDLDRWRPAERRSTSPARFSHEDRWRPLERRSISPARYNYEEATGSQSRSGRRDRREDSELRRDRDRRQDERAETGRSFLSSSRYESRTRDFEDDKTSRSREYEGGKRVRHDARDFSQADRPGRSHESRGSEKSRR